MSKNYPRAVVVQPESVDSNVIRINSEDLLDIDFIPTEPDYLGYRGFAIRDGSKYSILAPRNDQEFKDSGFFLSHCYDWQIVKDSVGSLVLVPTRRE